VLLSAFVVIGGYWWLLVVIGGYWWLLVVIGAISSNRTLEYAEEFSHIDVLVAVLTFYSKI
jgi:hypothetical protein